MCGSHVSVGNYLSVPRGTDGRYPRGFALQVAEELREILSPACERIEIAGSIRRKSPDVKDVELLVIPRKAVLNDLFDREIESRNFLEERLNFLLECPYSMCGQIFGGGLLSKRVNVNGQPTWGDKNKFARHNPSQMPVDIFITNEQVWGMSSVIRTGSADFVKSVMSRFLELGMKGTVSGGVFKDGMPLPCPDEQSVFERLGWSYIEPEQRA